MAPNLHYARPDGKCCGGIPRVDVIHLHHGVWLSNGTAGEGEGNGFGGLYPFMASGEEKTVYEFPHGYGYPVGASDTWILNYMIHNLTVQGGAGLHHLRHRLRARDLARRRPDHPGAPDLDGRREPPHLPGVRRPSPQRRQREVHLPRHGQAPLRRRRAAAQRVHGRPSRHARGDRRPPAPRRPLRRPRPHPPRHQAGARDDPRHGARLGAAVPLQRALLRQARPDLVGHGDDRHAAPTGAPRSRPATCCASAPPTTPPAPRGTSRWGSWSSGRPGTPTAASIPSPTRIDERGHVTHGHLAEDNNHGGAYSLGQTATAFPDCSRKTVQISEFQYNPGDFTATGMNRCIPTVTRGPLDHLRQRRRQPALPRQSAEPDQGLHGLGLPHRHLVPEPVRAEHRHLLSAGQRARRL